MARMDYDRVRRENMMRGYEKPVSFKAKYAGTCALCGESIVVGQRVIRMDFGIVHPRCA